MEFADLEEGHRIEKTYHVTPHIYDTYLALFGDTNPVHVSESYCREHGFDGIVMHGNILGGFISNFVGTVIPIKKTLEQSVNIQFRSPIYVNDQVLYSATVIQKVEAVSAFIIDLQIHNQTRRTLAATARIQIGVLP